MPSRGQPGSRFATASQSEVGAIRVTATHQAANATQAPYEPPVEGSDGDATSEHPQAAELSGLGGFAREESG